MRELGKSSDQEPCSVPGLGHCEEPGPAADSCWWLEPWSVYGCRRSRSEASSPSSLPVEATFRQMGGMPKTREGFLVGRH